MKTSFKSLLALVAIGSSALLSQAQTAQKIAIVDLGAVFQGHYKTAEQQVAFQAAGQKAEQELGVMQKDIDGLINQYKELAEKTKNPAITAEARGAAEAEAMKKGEEIRAKQKDAENFVNSTRQQLGEKSQNFQNSLIAEISKVATDIAKKKGATILLEKRSTVFNDASYEITDEVLAEVNKGKTVAAPAAAKPADDSAPKVTFPGAKK